MVTGVVSATEAVFFYFALIGRSDLLTLKTGTASDKWVCLQTESLGGWRGKAASLLW